MEAQVPLQGLGLQGCEETPRTKPLREDSLKGPCTETLNPKPLNPKP